MKLMNDPNKESLDVTYKSPGSEVTSFRDKKGLQEETHIP